MASIEGRIGILVGNRFSSYAEGVLINLGKMLGDAFNLDIVTYAYNTPLDLEENYNIHQYTKKIFLDPLGFRSHFSSCRQYIQKKTPNFMMNIVQPNRTGLPLALLGKLTDVKTGVYMTGDSYNAYKLRHGLKKLRYWLKNYCLSDLSYVLSDRVFPLGEYLESELLNHGIDGTKIKVLPQPFDHRSFSPVSDGEKKRLRREIGIPLEKKVLLYVGRLSWLKGADRLFQVAQEIIDKSDEYFFCIVGRGSYLHRFRKLPSRYLRCFGIVPYRQVKKFYQVSDLFVFPSRTEGVPTVVLESLASRLPVIASPAGETPNLVSNIAESPEEVVSFVLDEKWERDPFPESRKWESLKNQYQRYFDALVS